MKFWQLLILLPSLMILTAAGPDSTTGTRQASCVVDIWCGLNFQEGLADGRFIYDDVKVALCGELSQQTHNLLGVPPEVLQEYVRFEPTRDPQQNSGFSTLGQGPGQRSRMTLSLTLDDKAHPAAREFMDKMIDALPGVIDHMQRRDLEGKLNEIQAARREFAVQQHRLKESADILRSVGMNGRSEPDILTLTRGLDQEVLQLNMDTAALAAQRDILAKTIDRISVEAAVKSQVDAVAKELENIVNLKEQKLESVRALSKAGNQSSADLSDAETAVAEARVQWLERRDAVERETGGDAMADLRKQLVQAEVNLAQDKARMDAIGKESDALNKALDLDLENDASMISSPGDISDTKVGELLQQWNDMIKPAIRVVSEQ